jgi:hypothetical protein
MRADSMPEIPSVAQDAAASQGETTPPITEQTGVGAKRDTANSIQDAIAESVERNAITHARDTEEQEGPVGRGADGLSAKGRARLLGMAIRRGWPQTEAAKRLAVESVERDIGHRSYRVRAAAIRNLIGMEAQNIRCIEVEAGLHKGESQGTTVNVQVNAALAGLGSLSESDLAEVARRLKGGLE